jgi:hypothetical protein
MKSIRFRYSIRSLMIMTGIFAILLGIIPVTVHHLKLQRRVRAIVVELDRPTSLSLSSEVPLSEALNLLTHIESNPALPDGIPVRYDPTVAGRLEVLLSSPVTINAEGVPLRSVLERTLNSVGLTYSNAGDFVLISEKQLSGGTDSFVAQNLAFQGLKDSHSMVGMREAEQASVPFPESRMIVFPAGSKWGDIQERRIDR